jgi:soluble cytochrome b562
MTISGISSIIDPYQSYQTNGQNNFAQFQQTFQSLGSALQSGDLQGARQVFADLQQMLSNSSASNQTQNGQQNPFATDMNALSKALSGTGNLNDAQAAYKKLQQDMQAVQGHHHHRHHHNVSASDPGSGQNTLATDFQALGQALQSGNLSGAQTAFAQLQQDFQTYNPSGQVTTQPEGSSSINTTT